ncbi:MAG: Panacea domain-containing protein [Sphingomicrobium sp.]
MTSAAYDARAVANFILDRADEDRLPLTQLALLKIIYFAHGWYLAAKDKPLVSQPVEAWKYGPVIKVVRDAFKEFGKKPITGRAERLVLSTGEFRLVEANIEPEDAEFIVNVYRTYRDFDALELSDLTHASNSPWDRVWNPRSASGGLGLRIKNDDIRSYFLTLKSAAPVH